MAKAESFQPHENDMSRVIDHVEHAGVVRFTQLLRVNQKIAITCKYQKFGSVWTVGDFTYSYIWLKFWKN